MLNHLHLDLGHLAEEISKLCKVLMDGALSTVAGCDFKIWGEATS